MTQLIITLPLDIASPAALFDYVQSPDGRAVNAHASVPLALLPAQTERQGEVVVVLPARALSWHQVQLPQGSLPRQLLGERRGNRLRAILDGLLEDQLLDDPSQCHLALQPQPVTSAPVWVLACERAWLDAGLKALAQAGLVVVRIVPEFTMQSLDGTVFVTEHATGAQAAGLWAPRGPGSDAVLVCPLTPAMAFLLAPPDAAQVPGIAGAETPAPTGVRLVAEPAVAALAEQMFQRPVQIEQRAQRLLQAAQSPWDLAQFELAHAGRSRRGKQLAQGLANLARAPQWRAARWSLALLVLVNVMGLNALAWHEQSRLDAQRQQIRAVLTDTFPKLPVVVDAPLQMAREVAVLQRTRGNAAGTDLEGMLASFSALAQQGYVPDTIEYAANELRLSGPAMPATATEQVLGGLASRGLKASLQGGQWLLAPGGAP